MRTKENNQMQWLDVLDDRFEWLNVADWEPRDGGLQPVRVPKFWRDQWPLRTARRGKSAAGVALRFRTDSKKLALRVTLIASPDAPDNPAVGWERSRPAFFSFYRDGKYISSIAALTVFSPQDITLFADPEISGEAEIQVLLPCYWHRLHSDLEARRAGPPPPYLVSWRLDHARPWSDQSARDLSVANIGDARVRAAQLRLRRQRLGR